MLLHDLLDYNKSICYFVFVAIINKDCGFSHCSSGGKYCFFLVNFVIVIALVGTLLRINHYFPFNIIVNCFPILAVSNNV